MSGEAVHPLQNQSCLQILLPHLPCDSWLNFRNVQMPPEATDLFVKFLEVGNLNKGLTAAL